MSETTVNVGDAIFHDIDSNEFLNELYANLLHNYGIRLLGFEGKRQTYNVDLDAALRFADLLSKSTHATERDRHRVWAQEIALLCQILYPNDALTRAYVPTIFTTLGNYPALRQLGATSDAGLLADAFEAYQGEYLTVPGTDGMKFFAPQKQIYDHMTSEEFSFSAPTSLGKSFIMRTFITTQVRNETRANFAIIVPTKALINETRSKLINELEEDLERYNYRIVSAAGDIVLEGDHHFIFVLTPERLLYLLISKPQLHFDYVFFDEAHKLTGQNSRAPFYYQTVTILQSRPRPPHIIFASPNIPNPEVFLRLLQSEAKTGPRNSFATRYSPVVQFKYLVNLDEQEIATYNDHSQEFTFLATVNALPVTATTFIELLTSPRPVRDEKVSQTIVFHGSRQRVIDAAKDYARSQAPLRDPDLDALAKDVERDVHEDYFLCELLRKGVAYHIGYLPPAIRERIEDLFRHGKIITLFCTSTLLEGVNLPADNLVILNEKIGRKTMTPVDFKNLLGRVGRIQYNLYGNVFILTGATHTKKHKAEKLLQAEVPVQRLSIDSSAGIITEALKQGIVESLKQGRVDFPKGNETYEVYQMKRKFGLMLLRDITEDRDSLVRREFTSCLDEDDLETIRSAFTVGSAQDDDINISSDQTASLNAAIRAGLKYPNLTSNGRFDFDDTFVFLEKLANIFNWRIYDSQTLGKIAKDSSSLTLLRWYAVLLTQWMEGHGLRSIMNKALEYRRSQGNIYIQGQGVVHYDDSPVQRNIVFSDILKTLEDVILFSLSNYFLKFSNEYKLVHGVEQFENDWYEFVEYGTIKRETILLQRFGFSRESATYIRRNVTNPIAAEGNKFYLNPNLLESPNINVRKEAVEIKFNVPEAFSMPHFRF